MKNNTKFLALLMTTFIISSIGCTSKGNILSQQAKEDIAANNAIVAKMKSRTYNSGIKSTSNSISEVLSNIDKSARLLENEIGQIYYIETGFSVLPNKEEFIKQEQEDNGETYSNTFKYTGTNDILWVRIQARELSTGSTNVDMTFARSAKGNGGKYIRNLPPLHTQSIYEKLWLAIEKELK
jgi:hypothetical protein